MRHVLLAVLALALPGCRSSAACPTGYTMMGGACIPNDSGDAGAPDSGPDAPGTDAHVLCRGACSNPTPYCLVSGSTERCVECLDSTQCLTPINPRCFSNGCLICLTDADCTHLSATPVCNAEECVQCNTNAECDAAHGCDTRTHTCVAVTPRSKFACDA
jgi:hypothetical protein